MYEPLRVFLAAAAIVALGALIIWGRFFVLLIQGEGQGHVQSVVLGSTLFVVAVQLAALGIIGDLLAANRVLMQRTLERVRRVELTLGVPPSHYEPASDGDTPVAELAEERPTATMPGHTSRGVPPGEADTGDTEEHALPLGGRS
jgi:hypothetical protein